MSLNAQGPCAIHPHLPELVYRQVGYVHRQHHHFRCHHLDDYLQRAHGAAHHAQVGVARLQLVVLLLQHLR